MIWTWIGILFALFVVYRVGQFLWWHRTMRLARSRRIETGLAEWAEANPGKRISVGMIMTITRENWDAS